MSDDRKDEQVHQSKPSESAPENAPPFTPNVDSSDVVALSGRIQARTAGAGALSINAQVFPPLIPGTVLYVDFGFTSACEYWTEVAKPAYERFVNEENRGNAIAACQALWPIHDWLWHDQHPGQDTGKNRKDYEQFREQIFKNCPELAWVRDVADAGKHRGLGRRDVRVREVAKTWPSNMLPLKIILDDRTEHSIADVLIRVVEYFRKTHFPG